MTGRVTEPGLMSRLLGELGGMQTSEGAPLHVAEAVCRDAASAWVALRVCALGQ